MGYGSWVNGLQIKRKHFEGLIGRKFEINKLRLKL